MKRKPDILVAIRPLLATALLVSAVASCATTRMVRVEQLQRLDGYEAGQVSQPTQQVETLDGEPERLDSGANLYLGVTGRWVGGRFESIRVRDGRFEGRTAEGLAIEAPMDQITAAKISRPENLKTFLAIGGVLLGLLTIGGLMFISISASQVQGGRALRIRGKSVAAPLVISEGWRTPDIGPDISWLSPEAREALAAAWTSSARSEHASVPAFSRLSLSLVSLGAPAHLVQAALRAALEEIEHARLSFALAEAYGLTPVGPGPLVELTSAPAVTVTSRADLVCESLVDGCLLEGAAAAYAQVALARASDPAVCAALAIIARDEGSHSELAWKIACWGYRRADVDLRRRMLGLVRDQRAPSPPVDVPARLSSELEAHGWPAAAVWHDLFERTRAEVISRVEREMRSERVEDCETSERPGDPAVVLYLP
jgi:hypothetical protein